MLRYLLPVYQAIPNCHEPLTFDTIPSKPLLGYVTALLGLLPGVLFHSCRPSFRHTGVMFPDFGFLTRSGDLWDTPDSSL